MQKWEYCYLIRNIESRGLRAVLRFYEVRMATQEGYRIIFASDKWTMGTDDEKQMSVTIAKLGVEGWMPSINLPYGGTPSSIGTFMRPCLSNE